MVLSKADKSRKPGKPHKPSEDSQHPSLDHKLKLTRDVDLWARAQPPQSKIRRELRAWERDESKRFQEGFIDPAPFFRSDGISNSLYAEPEPYELIEEDDGPPYEPGSNSQECDDPELIGGKMDLQPGDIVSLKTRSASPFDYLAVLCRVVQNQYQFYTLSGLYLVKDKPRTRITSEVIRGVVGPDLLNPILPFLPENTMTNEDEKTGSVPRTAAQPVFNLLSKFGQDASQYYKEHSDALDNIYERLAQQSDRRFMTLDEITENVVGRRWDELKPPERFCIHLCLENTIGTKTWSSNRDSYTTYGLMPATTVRNLHDVVKWARNYQDLLALSTKTPKSSRHIENPIGSFILKAQKLIAKSRALRPPGAFGTLGPIQQDPNTLEEFEEEFTLNDQKIIELLYALYADPPPLHHPILTSVGSLIIRAIGAYPAVDLNASVGYLLLQELGVVSPWTNQRPMSWYFRLSNTGTDSETDGLYQQCLKPSYQEFISELSDSMADLRKDLGDLPVFCIDSASTTEVDDGFSIEPHLESPELKWLHIHIADPSAFISPYDTVARHAERALSTTYTVEYNARMMPAPALIDKCSLSPNRPALTISALLGMDGSLKDVKVQPTIVQNVVKLTPDQLQREIWIPVESKELFTVGDYSPAMSSEEDASWKTYIGDIKAVLDVAAAHLQCKRDHPDYLPASNDFPLQTVSAVVQNARYEALDFSKSHHNRVDPAIRLISRRLACDPPKQYSPHNVASSNLVAEVMQIAGEAVALWCKKRDLPIVFSGTKESGDWSVQRIQEYHRSSQGARDARQNWPTAICSSSPVPHHYIGVDQYARVTSPLRRYGDLISHWQINAQLRYEAEITKNQGSNPTRKLPFSKSEIDGYLKHSAGREYLLRRLSQTDDHHWKLQALFRAFHFGQATLPKVLHAKVFQASKSGVLSAHDLRGVIQEYDCKCVFEPSSEGFEVNTEAGDVIPVTMSKVDPGPYGHLYVRPTGTPLKSSFSDVH